MSSSNEGWTTVNHAEVKRKKKDVARKRLQEQRRQDAEYWGAEKAAYENKVKAHDKVYGNEARRAIKQRKGASADEVVQREFQKKFAAAEAERQRRQARENKKKKKKKQANVQTQSVPSGPPLSEALKRLTVSTINSFYAGVREKYKNNMEAQLSMFVSEIEQLISHTHWDAPDSSEEWSVQQRWEHPMALLSDDVFDALLAVMLDFKEYDDSSMEMICMKVMWQMISALLQIDSAPPLDTPGFGLKLCVAALIRVRPWALTYQLERIRQNCAASVDNDTFDSDYLIDVEYQEFFIWCGAQLLHSTSPHWIDQGLELFCELFLPMLNEQHEGDEDNRDAVLAWADAFLTRLGAGPSDWFRTAITSEAYVRAMIAVNGGAQLSGYSSSLGTKLFNAVQVPRRAADGRICEHSDVMALAAFDACALPRTAVCDSHRIDVQCASLFFASLFQYEEERERDGEQVADDAPYALWLSAHQRNAEASVRLLETLLSDEVDCDLKRARFDATLRAMQSFNDQVLNAHKVKSAREKLEKKMKSIDKHWRLPKVGLIEAHMRVMADARQYGQRRR